MITYNLKCNECIYEVRSHVAWILRDVEEITDIRFRATCNILRHFKNQKNSLPSFNKKNYPWKLILWKINSIFHIVDEGCKICLITSGVDEITKTRIHSIWHAMHP